MSDAPKPPRGKRNGTRKVRTPAVIDPNKLVFVKYSEEVAAAICSQIASGDSLKTICNREGMPDRAAVFMWLKREEGFLAMYNAAVAERAECHAEEILDIADDGTNDWMEQNAKDNAGWRVNGEAIQRSRVRIDTRKWLMSKLHPTKYGDFQRVEVTHTFTELSDEELDAEVLRLAMATGIVTTH
jgi:hypothetical protein